MSTLGGSTKMILVALERDLIDAPTANVAKDILTNDKFNTMQKKIDALKEDRNSIYSIQGQVAVLEENLKTMNATAQKQLAPPIERLTHLINQGIIIDQTCTTLETTLSKMAEEHLAIKKARHHSTEKTVETGINNENFAKKIDERTKEVDQLTKHFSLQHQQIVRTYSDTYTETSNLPGGKPLIKPISALITTPEVEHQQLRH